MGDAYGRIYQNAMRNPDLPVISKAIYAYLCSFANENGVCYPLVDTILKELNINRNTFYKHCNNLKRYGYLQTTQVRTSGGVYERTVYQLIHTPNTNSKYTV